jgi:hypothetical protein
MISVTGLDGVGALLRQVDRARRDLPQETAAALRRVAPELVQDAKDHAEQVLPREGGYAAEVARRTHFHVRVTRTPSGVALEVQAEGPDYRLDKQGRLRHPVYAKGPRSQWNWAREPQRVTPGWFTRPMRSNEAHVRVVLVTAGSRAIRGR